MPGWRDEVCTALDFWLEQEGGSDRTGRPRNLGPARPESTRGWFAVDLRSSSVDVEQLDSLILAGPDSPDPSHAVLDATVEGPLLRVKVADFVDLADAHVWQRKQPSGFLVRRLRDGIAGAGGMANDLAAGRTAAAPRSGRGVAGFTDAQQQAYESCLAPGVRLVWGPPGTGKTRVLVEAIGALLKDRQGSRVLLVSATNIAVDNALLGVVGTLQPARGLVVRAGPAHHPEVADNPDVSLSALTRSQLAEIDAERLRLQARLVEFRDLDDEVARLEQLASGLDPDAYAAAAELLAAEARIPGLTAAVATADAALEGRRRSAEAARTDVDHARQGVDGTVTSRQGYVAIGRIRVELDRLTRLADEAAGRAVAAGQEAWRLDDELRRLDGGSMAARLGRRGRIRTVRAAFEDARDRAAGTASAAAAAQDLLHRTTAAGNRDAAGWQSHLTHSVEEVAAAEAALAAALDRADDAAAAVAATGADHDEVVRRLAIARAAPRATDEQRALVADADRRRLPDHHRLLLRARAEVAAGADERRRLERSYAEIEKQFDGRRRTAEQEVLGRARLVATTLARLRSNDTLLKGPYDVVLVDEVAAANLPEVLLAVSVAGRTAVLFGDFLQLGAILPPAVSAANRHDVERWLKPDVFAHCGITDARSAVAHPGCSVLDQQHRFGPDVMELANTVAYGGLLTAGPSVRAHPDGDPEIVLVDTDGLGDLARIRSTGRWKGWWPAGALLTRALADYHLARGERTGVVTPYADQVQATVQALRDQEGSSGAVTEVGTAHRFQGREFPVVVFDLVEDDDKGRWMAAPGRTARNDGLRLFTVAVTRTRSRLYLIGSRQQIGRAKDGSPLRAARGLLETGRIRCVAASTLITPTSVSDVDRLPLGPFGSELAGVLAEHVKVTDIQDELGFYETFTHHLDAARHSLWIWAAWTGPRLDSLLPNLTAAVARGVRVTVFVRDPTDSLQRRPDFQGHVQDLRATGATVVQVNLLHQKIVVVDERTVLLGSLNVLSQRRTREVMILMSGGHFAKKLLEHEQAERFARPPRCGACGTPEVDLRRGKGGDWYWHCLSADCPQRAPGGRAWRQAVAGRPGRGRGAA